MNQAYIVEAIRTAGGRRNGKLAAWHPADLAAEVLDAIVARSKIDPCAIEDVIMGCVSQCGEQSQQIGRNAVLASSLPDSVPAVTIDRQCGSSQQAVQFAAQAIISGAQEVVIAAGVECMSRVAYGSPTSLAVNAGLGGPMSPRLRKRYGAEGFSGFSGAQMLTDKYGLCREELDLYSLESHRRAAAATLNGAFEAEILPVETAAGVHGADEGIRFDATLAAISSVKPMIGSRAITAANTGQICDGAAGILIVSERALQTHRLKPLARIHQSTVSAGDPVIMLEEPIRATSRALKRCGMRLDDIDLFEINEAFASVPLAWAKALGADANRMNVNGGAIALGHPLGASGAKLLTTLVHALRTRNKRFGLLSMCEGGGTANATIVETA